MPLTVNNLGDNPQQPGITADAYIPDQLIASNLKLVTDTITLILGQTLQRGTVLGKITASGKYTTALAAAVDGSQNPIAILTDYADASLGDVLAPIYIMGEFNIAAMTFGAGITAAAAKAALQPLGIFIKTSVSATDPT